MRIYYTSFSFLQKARINQEDGIDRLSVGFGSLFAPELYELEGHRHAQEEEREHGHVLGERVLVKREQDRARYQAQNGQYAHNAVVQPVQHERKEHGPQQRGYDVSRVTNDEKRDHDERRLPFLRGNVAPGFFQLLCKLPPNSA